MRLWHTSPLVLGIRALLVVVAAAALFTGRGEVAFVSSLTLILSMAPEFVVRRFGVHLPVSFIAAITAFVFSTVFLGEVMDFYERYWWWDIVMHAGSAMGFGFIGVIFALFLFEGDRYAAPPWALSLIAFSFAVTIGALWEIFEFAMDQIFGLDMQKSGLVDTMTDLIVDAAGAGTAALVGFLYFKGREIGGVSGLLAEFLRLNRRLFRRYR